MSTVLGELIGIDAPELDPRRRGDGVIEFKGRVGTREVEGTYEPEVYRLTWNGRQDDGKASACTGNPGLQAIRPDHTLFRPAIESLLDWLHGREIRL